MGRVTTTTNGKGQRQTETRTTLDEVLQTADHQGTRALTETFSYDSFKLRRVS